MPESQVMDCVSVSPKGGVQAMHSEQKALGMEEEGTSDPGTLRREAEPSHCLLTCRGFV